MDAVRIVNEEMAVISTEKTLDNNNAHEMAALVAKAQREGYKFIVIDMGDLEFLASAGVGSILGSVEVARGMGGDIVLCSASEKILHVLEVLDLVEYLTIKNDVAEAETCCVH